MSEKKKKNHTFSVKDLKEDGQAQTQKHLKVERKMIKDKHLVQYGGIQVRMGLLGLC